MSYAIELQGINKHFGPVHANRDIDLAVPSGSIHGVIGENGAGKSTLMSILYGFYTADSGEIRVDGKPVTIHNSQDAIDLGIGMVHQHFMLVEPFTVLENVMLGAEDHARLSVARSHARAALTEISERYGLTVDPDAVVGDLSVGLQQRVEILKALYRKAKILILDEPTGVLTPQEADQLFAILDTLRAQGVTVLLITHKLREIMAITNNVSVMRQGTMVAHRQTSQTHPEELAELMVGRKVLLRVERTPADPGEVRLRTRNLEYVDARGVRQLKNIDMQLRSGEIVGVAGVSGNGQSQLLEVLSGALAPGGGAVDYYTHAGHFEITPERPTDASEVRHWRVAHVPEDRLSQGLVKDFVASESAILGYQQDPAYGEGWLLQPPSIRQATQEMMQAYDVRPPLPSLRSANFSGGNQQKLILAREIMRRPDVLLVGQPTRGVDIGAIEFIHSQLIAARDQGAAVLLVSVELDEILSLSDRILVMFDGAIVGEVSAEQADERTLGLMMANAHDSDAGGEKS